MKNVFLWITCQVYIFLQWIESSKAPLKRFLLLAQDMMEHSSATAVTASNTVDTELIGDVALVVVGLLWRCRRRRRRRRL